MKPTKNQGTHQILKIVKNKIKMIKYRNDIDELRGYAVFAVIIFHLGFLPNGYLRVDVFFVISGFLITSIIFKELTNNSFSKWKYKYRIINLGRIG